MELITLDDDFQPVRTIENFESLIWTERYSQNGDFELVSTDIRRAVNLLPRESCITLRDSNEVMIVENHKLIKPKRDKQAVSITGRSYETVLERRASVNQLHPTVIRSAWGIDAVKESDAAYLAMRIVLGDSLQFQDSVVVLLETPPAVSPLDAIPQIRLIMPKDYVDIISAGAWSDLTTYVTNSKVRYVGYIWKAKRNNINVVPSLSHPDDWEQLSIWQSYEIKPQNLYATVMELVNASRHGIKTFRPELNHDGKVGVEIYNGANLTGEGATGDPNNVYTVDVRFDQIDDATYLLSNQGSTNVGYVYTPDGAQTVLKTTAPEPSGLDRRVLVVDNSNDTSAVGNEVVTSSEIRRTRGLIELYKHNATALFDGEVARQIAAGYNKDYFLGDIIKLIGEYGLEQNARVSEFIRSEDSSGEKAYPSFEAVDD